MDITTQLAIFVVTLVYEGIIILLLSLLPKLGNWGKETIEACMKAPALDWMLSFIVWIPWFISSLVEGWQGLVAVLISQAFVLQLWVVGHEWLHRNGTQGSPIARFQSKRLGRWRNHLALWITTLGVPVLFLIRFAEIFLYPCLVWLLKFPKYRHREWVNLSRGKFQGLIGHDLIWCLYCDWMTGVYSLGAEMLRNVESFWCPIRFYDDKKCENCRLIFPDIEGGWVAADGTMSDVEQVLHQKYSDSHNSWFGHPERQQD